MPKNSENLIAILSQAQGGLAKIAQLAKQLHSLNELVSANLPEPINKHVRVLNLNQGKLVLEADNASWAAALRYMLPELLSKLRKTPEFAGLIRIDQQIAMRTHKKSAHVKPEPSEFNLSQQSTEILQSAINNSSDPALKKALEKFLQHYGVKS
jgi:hypothetical protein